MQSAIPALQLADIAAPSEWKQVVTLALPLMGTSAIICAIGVVDIMLAGRAGPVGQAAVGIADQLIFISVLLGAGLGAAIGCHVSQALGAGQIVVAQCYAREGLAWSFVFGCLAALACVVGGPHLFASLHCNAEVSSVGLPYLQICGLGNIPFIIALAQTSILRSLSLGAVCLRLWLVVGVTSIAGSYLLWFCEASPTHGCVSSLAWAWDAGAALGALIGFVELMPSFRRSSGTTHGTFPNLHERTISMLSIGLPALLSEASIIGSNFLIYVLLAHLPQSEHLQAAWSISLKIEETVALVPLLALAAATATIVGQNIGAGQSDRAHRVSWQIAIGSAASMFFFALALQMNASVLASTFTDNTSVLELVKLGIIAAGWSLPFLALTSVLLGSLEGGGLTGKAFAIQLAGKAGIRIPLAAILTFACGWGFLGVWVAVLISRFAVAVLCALTFVRCPQMVKIFVRA